MTSASLKLMFGRRVRVIRRLREMTQEDLAEATQLSAEYISKVERGRASPSFDVVAKMASVLAVDPSAFFNFSDMTSHGE